MRATLTTQLSDSQRDEDAMTNRRLPSPEQTRTCRAPRLKRARIDQLGLRTCEFYRMGGAVRWLLVLSLCLVACKRQAPLAAAAETDNSPSGVIRGANTGAAARGDAAGSDGSSRRLGSSTSFVSREADAGPAGAPALGGAPASAMPLAGAPAGAPGAPGMGGSGQAASGPSAGRASDGWNELIGAHIGSGKQSGADLRRSVRVNMFGDDSSYMLGRAFVTRSSVTSIGTDLVIEVTNVGDQLRCFVQADAVKRKDADGKSLPGTFDFIYVSGSNAVDSVGGTDTCLGPNETGYFLDITLQTTDMGSLYDLLAEVDLTITSDPADDYERPQYRLVPTAYSVQGEQLQVTLVNEGSAAAPLREDSNLRYMLLDDAGDPLDWGFLDVDTLSDVPPGESITASSDIYYAGSASRLRVLADY